MISDDYFNNKNVTSFLIECLVWNIPTKYINDCTTWNERIKQSMLFLNFSIKNESYKNWVEVSEMSYLFQSFRKWTIRDIQNFVNHLWNYLEY